MKIPWMTPKSATPRKQTIDRTNSPRPQPPEAQDAGDLHEPEARGDDDRAEGRVGQVRQEPRPEDQEERDAGGADDARELRLRPRRLGHRGARRAAADGEALEEAGGHVGGPEGDELLVGVDLVAVAQGEGAREDAHVRERDEGDGDGVQEEGPDVAQGDRGDLEGRQALRQGADDGDARTSPRGGRADETIVAPTTATSGPGTREPSA